MLGAIRILRVAPRLAHTVESAHYGWLGATSGVTFIHAPAATTKPARWLTTPCEFLPRRVQARSG
jgi:hypothetical protein